MQVGQSGACPSERSFDSGYGQNMYATSDTSPSIEAAVDAWYSELRFYNFSNPQYSGATANVIQVRLSCPFVHHHPNSASHPLAQPCFLPFPLPGQSVFIANFHFHFFHNISLFLNVPVVCIPYPDVASRVCHKLHASQFCIGGLHVMGTLTHKVQNNRHGASCAKIAVEPRAYVVLSSTLPKVLPLVSQEDGRIEILVWKSPSNSGWHTHRLVAIGKPEKRLFTRWSPFPAGSRTESCYFTVNDITAKSVQA
jgi:hypothetical protein